MTNDPPCTPPPQLLSPQPLTPRPSRVVSPPRTPLPKLFTNLTPRPGLHQWDLCEGASLLAAISRPESACSNYSSSSDSSLDSLTTFTTAGGSCVSPGTEASFFPEDSEKEAANVVPGDSSKPSKSSKGRKQAVRVRKTKWTEEMDSHLWRTYIIYQQDPKITPFYVLPGQVPPLGVCCKVARETKRSWKEAKMGDAWRGAPSTPRPKRKSRVPGCWGEGSETTSTGNRGDILRKTSPYSWPASEAATRRRLRELCRGNYGPSVGPHREYRQQRRPASTTPRLLPPRSSTVSPSPLSSATSDRIGSRDAFLFSTRSIALSLTTSTASTMNPNGLLAAIAAGYDVEAGAASGFGGAGINFGESVSGNNTGVDDEDRMEQGSPVRVAARSNSGAPGLLPPLELKSSSSSFGTWPRRLGRREVLQNLAEDSFVLPSSRRARRGTLGDLFGNPVASSSSSTNNPPPTTAASASSGTSTTASNTARTRSRGFTIGASFGGSLTSRRRYRPSPPLLTVTGPVSYDSPNDAEMVSPLAGRQSSLEGFDLPKRLGSPFEERGWKTAAEQSDGDGNTAGVKACEEEFGEAGSKDGGETIGEVSTPIRPVKRARE